MLLSKKKRVRKRVRKRARTRARTKVRKRVTRRAKRAKTQKKTIKRALKAKEVQVGRVTHYFPHVKAGAIMVESGTLALGDTIHIKGHTTDFKQKIRSLQIDRAPIQEGSVGDEVGALVKSRVRINDKVFKVKA